MGIKNYTEALGILCQWSIQTLAGAADWTLSKPKSFFLGQVVVRTFLAAICICIMALVAVEWQIFSSNAPSIWSIHWLFWVNFLCALPNLAISIGVLLFPLQIYYSSTYHQYYPIAWIINDVFHLFLSAVSIYICAAYTAPSARYNELPNKSYSARWEALHGHDALVAGEYRQSLAWALLVAEVVKTVITLYSGATTLKLRHNLAQRYTIIDETADINPLARWLIRRKDAREAPEQMVEHSSASKDIVAAAMAAVPVPVINTVGIADVVDAVVPEDNNDSNSVAVTFTSSILPPLPLPQPEPGSNYTPPPVYCQPQPQPEEPQPQPQPQPQPEPEPEPAKSAQPPVQPTPQQPEETLEEDARIAAATRESILAPPPPPSESSRYSQ